MMYRHDFFIERDDFAALKDVAKSRRLIPFVGSGFSRCLNSAFPTWDDVVVRAATLLKYNPRILGSLANNYEIGEMLRRDAKTWQQFVSWLRSELDADHLASITDATPHHWLARLDVKAIYTTNWDSWIERALQAVPKPYRLVNTPQKLHEDRKNLDVIKFHGDLNASESMVFAESGYYDRMRFDHPFDVLLRADCLQSSLLFLGYSFNDVNIRFLWNRLWESFATRSGRRDATCRAYLCVVGDAHIARNCLCADGISVIGLNPVSPTQSLRKLLNEIVDAQ